MNAPDRRQVLEALPAEVRSAVRAVLRAARARRQAVYLVGGPVRDLLLGRSVLDVDLIVEPTEAGGAPELAVAAEVEGARVVTHGRFGTVRLEGQGFTLDLATVRSETYTHAGALPKVAPGTLAEDLRRRDFSVNALALPLSEAARRHAPLIDVDRGVRDLERGLLRVFHPRSFHDDPTRALRAGRLAARLGFRLTRGSRTALRDALRDGAFGNVTGERYRREVMKLFDDAHAGMDPAQGLRLLDEWHVLAGLEPGLCAPRTVRASLRRLGRALRQPPWPLRPLRPFVPGLALWLSGLDATLRRRTLARLAVRGEVARRIAGFPKTLQGLRRSLDRARGRGAIDAVLAPLDEETLLALYAGADAADRRRIARFAAEDRERRAPVTGDDLVGEGLAGAAVGRALARVRAAWLDGRVRSRDEALALAREVGRRRPRGGRRRA